MEVAPFAVCQRLKALAEQLFPKEVQARRLELAAMAAARAASAAGGGGAGAGGLPGRRAAVQQQRRLVTRRLRTLVHHGAGLPGADADMLSPPGSPTAARSGAAAPGGGAGPLALPVPPVEQWHAPQASFTMGWWEPGERRKGARTGQRRGLGAMLS
ncbi:hypothetical protein FOA52_009756 [Chlamydomonas sp. UWO 241]|nr:hypothetical protein FOA52_009756 [Chlamydomonas sp. UWO 241]